MPRSSKVISLADAAGQVRDEATLAIGGSMFQNKPMALVRALVRRGAKRLNLVAVPQGSIDVDILIASGSVAEVIVPYVGFDHLGLAPSYRAAASSGHIRVWDYDETQIIAGLQAAAADLPIGITRTGFGSDLLSINPKLKEISNPFTDATVIAVPAITPDVAFIHASQGDMYGNLKYTGYRFGDRLIAEATRRSGGTVVASVEELVSHEAFTSDPFQTDIPSLFVDAVVEAPFGAHPCASHGDYLQDERALALYLTAARAGKASGYIAEYVQEMTTLADYLDHALTPSQLLDLKRGLR